MACRWAFCKTLLHGAVRIPRLHVMQGGCAAKCGLLSEYQQPHMMRAQAACACATMRVCLWP